MPKAALYASLSTASQAFWSLISMIIFDGIKIRDHQVNFLNQLLTFIVLLLGNIYIYFVTKRFADQFHEGLY